MSDSRRKNLLVEAIEANHVSFFSRFGRLPAGHLSTHDGVTRYFSGVRYPLFNGALAVEASVTSRAIQDSVEWFRTRGIPFLWWVLPSRRTARLVSGLEALGLTRAFDTPGMAMELASLGPPPPQPSGLRTESVAHTSDLATFGQTLNAGDFQAPDDVARTIPSLLRPDPGDTRFRFFVGFVDDEPVATSLRFVSDGVVGIYGIATVPTARHRGIGAAMTYSALADGRAAAGNTFAVLTATELGLPVYRRLGFAEECRLEAYAWAVSPVTG